MAHYALVNKDNIVVRVIVCDQDPMNIDITRKFAEDVSGRWLQTSYNTRGGIHYNQDGIPSGQPGFRGNYAGINYTYSDELDAFISPQPSESWTFDITTFQWKPPIDGKSIDITSEPLQYSSLKYSGSIISDSSPTQVRSI